MKEILVEFGLDEKDFSVRPFGNGLINRTWIAEDKTGNKKYILQKINQQVFRKPGDIAYNIRLVADHLGKVAPGYSFVYPCVSKDGTDLVEIENGYYRMFPFVENAHAVEVVETAGQAYEAAKQFAKFTKLLTGLDTTKLRITLPDFHSLSLRYRNFKDALHSGNRERIDQSRDLIALIEANKNIADQFENCKGILKVRCMHHDTKISNVLFDAEGKGLCVIDLDTVMPGYFISDVGDMMRTYLCPVSEEEKDLSKIEVRKDFYDAIVNGYLSEMGEELTEEEKKHFHYAGKFMIYMQAIRFLTDHLNGDVYYGAKYVDHNFVRAGNQAVLLQRLIELDPS